MLKLNMNFKEFCIKNMLKKLRTNNLRLELHSASLEEIKPIKANIWKWKYLNSFPSDFIFKEHENLLNNVTHIKSGNGNAHSRIKLPKEFNKEFAYLLGAMRDGSLISSSNKHWIRIYDEANSKWLKVVNEIFKDLFELELHSRRQKRFRVDYLDISSKPLFCLLSILVDGKIHKDVPQIIKTAPRELKQAYIEGFFDAEGHVPHKKGRQIDFTQKNCVALKFIKEYLRSIGVFCGKISAYKLPIYGKLNITKFYNLCNFRNEDKLNRFRAFVDSLS